MFGFKDVEFQSTSSLPMEFWCRMRGLGDVSGTFWNYGNSAATTLKKCFNKGELTLTEPDVLDGFISNHLLWECRVDWPTNYCGVIVVPWRLLVRKMRRWTYSNHDLIGLKDMSLVYVASLKMGGCSWRFNLVVFKRPRPANHMSLMYSTTVLLRISQVYMQ